MTKRIFYLRNVATIVACLAATTIFSGCEKDPDPIDEITAPGAVVNLTATAGNGQVTVTWETPTDDGGADITGYELTADNWTAKVTKPPYQWTHTFTGLTNGTEYTFKVRAVNEKGAGAESAATATPQGNPADPGQPGTEIAVKYRGEYSGDNCYGDPDAFYGVITLTANKILFKRNEEAPSEEMFDNVSTGTDHVVTYFVTLGTWAYLYSGITKIGLVWHSTSEDGSFILATGQAAIDWATGYNMAPYSQQHPVDLSDMPTGVHPLAGQLIIH
jgi:hypothetical protein